MHFEGTSASVTTPCPFPNIQQITVNGSLPMEKSWVPKSPISKRSGQMTDCLFEKNGRASRPHSMLCDSLGIIQ